MAATDPNARKVAILIVAAIEKMNRARPQGDVRDASRKAAWAFVG